MADTPSIHTPAHLFQNIKAGTFSSVYYFFGEEEYRISEAVKFVTRQFLPEKQLSTNVRRLDTRRNALDEILTIVANLPMLGEREVVIIDDIQRLKPEQFERLARLLTPHDPHRVVLFTTPAKRHPLLVEGSDYRRSWKKAPAIYNQIMAVSYPVEFSLLTPNEIKAAVVGKLKGEGMSIREDALAELVERIGGNRGALEQEVAKLISFMDAKGEITTTEVARVVADWSASALSTLSDFLIAGRSADATKEVRKLVETGSAPDYILASLHGHYLLLYLVKHDRPVARFGDTLYRLQKQSRSLADDRLTGAMVAIAACWSDLRKGVFQPAGRLEQLMLELTGPSRA